MNYDDNNEASRNKNTIRQRKLSALLDEEYFNYCFGSQIYARPRRHAYDNFRSYRHYNHLLLGMVRLEQNQALSSRSTAHNGQI